MISDISAKIKTRTPSKWTCQLFGSDSDIEWTPQKGKEPNWFWRTMQYLCFGNKWIKAQRFAQQQKN